MSRRLVAACDMTGIGFIVSLALSVVVMFVAIALFVLSFVLATPVVAIAIDVSLLIGGVVVVLTTALFASHVALVWRLYELGLVR